MKKGFLFFILFLTYLQSFSCSCDTIPYKEAIANAQEIFIGRLIEIKEVYSESYDNGGKYTRLWYAKFEVEKKWKGSNKKYVKVYQPSTSCDFKFGLLGRKYLVYAMGGKVFWYENEKSSKRLHTWLCSRTMSEFEYSGANIIADEVPRLNQSFPETIKLIDNRIVNTTNILLAIIIIVSIFGFFYRRKRGISSAG